MKRKAIPDIRLLLVLAETQTAFYRIRLACRHNNVDEKRFLRWWLAQAGSVTTETRQLRHENARLRRTIASMQRPSLN